MRTITINNQQYQLRASVYEVMSLLRDQQAYLVERENRIKRNKPVPPESEVVFWFIIEALWRFLVPRRILFFKFKPFISKKALAQAITLEELKQCDKIIAEITGMAGE